MREIHQLGLQYQKHQSATSGDESWTYLGAFGELNCNPETRRGRFADFPEVLEVPQLSVTCNG